MTTLLTPEQVAERLGLAPSTLRNWRHLRKGPPWVSLGNRARYREDSLEEWIQAQVEVHADDE